MRPKLVSRGRFDEGQHVRAGDVSCLLWIFLAAKLDTLFDRFTRGDRSRSGADGKSGFGLGLAIARAAAEKNRASLTAAETEEGRLRFTLAIMLR